MAKLRKMLGNIEQEEVVALMRLIETQSAQTLTKWAVDYVEEHYLIILSKYDCQDERLKNAVEAVKKHMLGELTLKDTKKVLADARKAAQELSDNPIVQATARAIATACATLTTPTNALGYTFYGAAAYAYNEVGLEQDTTTYDKFATQELQRILNSLQCIAVTDEPYPAKINWNC